MFYEFQVSINANEYGQICDLTLNNVEELPAIKGELDNSLSLSSTSSTTTDKFISSSNTSSTDDDKNNSFDRSLRSPESPERSNVNQLHFHVQFDHEEIEAASEILEPVPLSDKQKVVDELTARMKSGSINNPLSYLWGLVERYKQGKFRYVAGIKIEKERQRALVERNHAVQRHTKKKNIPGQSESGKQAAIEACSNMRKKLKGGGSKAR